MTEKLKAPKNGVTIRMYRPGHGDCFLLAMPREQGDEPFYVLIDCGFKPGSQNFIHRKAIDELIQHIGDSTGFHLDLVVITHEHQDHLNGIWSERLAFFDGFTIDKAWFAWTEDPTNTLANELRRKHRDQLLQLVEARQQLALAVGEDDPALERLDSFISLEFGGDNDAFNLEALRAAATDPNKVQNKRAMKLIKDKAGARQGVKFLYPGIAPYDIEGSAGIRAFVIGPPESADLLADEDPVGEEGFPGEEPGAHPLSFSAAIMTDAGNRDIPFNERYSIPAKKALNQVFFRDHYGKEEKGAVRKDDDVIHDDAPWRRIDSDWLYSAEMLALKLNAGINNTSLVLAFELPQTKKILLFVGDAQRGSWFSWKDVKWNDGGTEVKARDLLARTVLYKVGHHGSHNATLDGQADSEYANLAWMGHSAAKDEFTAMITAVNEWAVNVPKPPWNHPLPSIRRALIAKTQGRLFQTDTNQPEKPENVSDAAWANFLERSVFEELYFDYTVNDS